MLTNDGIIYTLPGYKFTDGEAVFRHDANPDLTRAGFTFPDGMAVPGVIPIPFVDGTYSVTFNQSNGKYSFTYPETGIPGTIGPGQA
jgi:hypothetical protein